MRRTRLAIVGVLIVVPFVLGAAAAEIYVRLASPYGYVTPEIVAARSPRYVPALFARNVFAAEERHVDGELSFEINARGYRGPPFAVPKPEGTTRIVVYGGSSAFDSTNSEGNDWPRRLEARLRELGHPEVEVINAGIPSHSTDDAVGRLFAEGHLFDPDYALLYCQWNDLKDLTSSEPLLRRRQPSGDDPRTTYQNSLDRWLSEISQVYVRLRARYYEWKFDIGSEGAVPQGDNVSSLNPDAVRQYRMNVTTFVDVARNAGAEPVLITEARLASEENTTAEKELIGYELVLLTHEGLLEAYRVTDGILGEVAEAKNVPLVDASSRMSGQDSYFRDHAHLTDLGSSVLADFVATSMARLLTLEPR